MNIFKNRIRAKKVIINNESSGTMRREYLKSDSTDKHPFITGRTLMNKLLINGKYADGCRQFTNKEIVNALKRCLKLIDTYNYSDKLDQFLSTRQAFCAKQTLLNIINHNYTTALRYLELCIDNDGYGFDLIISMNEYVLYNCLITGFIEALEQEEANDKCN